MHILRFPNNKQEMHVYRDGKHVILTNDGALDVFQRDNQGFIDCVNTVAIAAVTEGMITDITLVEDAP